MRIVVEVVPLSTADGEGRWLVMQGCKNMSGMTARYTF